MYPIPKSSELVDVLKDNYKEAIKSFSNVIELNSYFRREMILGDIDPEVGESVEAFIRFFNQVDDDLSLPAEERQPIKIFIDSCGGDLCATLTMIDAIEASKTPIWTINIGSAYSGGFFTLIAGHKRFAYPHASFLFHEGSTATGGTSGQFENYTAFYKKQLASLKDLVIKYTKITDDEYEKIKRDDIWYDTKDAIEKGIVDEVWGVRK